VARVKRPSFLKRQKEQARLAKARAKQETRLARRKAQREAVAEDLEPAELGSVGAPEGDEPSTGAEPNGTERSEADSDAET
jgi:hypothetical protein